MNKARPTEPENNLVLGRGGATAPTGLKPTVHPAPDVDVDTPQMGLLPNELLDAGGTVAMVNGTVISSFRDDHAFLSNFYKATFIEGDKEFSNVEQYFQYAKAVMFGDTETATLILNNADPRNAKRLGKRVKNFDHSVWTDCALTVMENGLSLKFRQNHDLQAKLLATGVRQLIEGNEWGDTYWGVCKGRGENHLGKLLMSIRDSLAAQ